MGKKSKKKTGRQEKRPVKDLQGAVDTAMNDLNISDRPWTIGDHVRLSGLSNDLYNGKYGKIVCLKVKDREDRIGVLVDGDSSPKAFRPSNLTHIVNENTSNPYKNVSTTEEMRHMRDQYENMKTRTEQESVGASQLAMMRLMKRMLSKDQQIKMFGRKLTPMPNFYQEIVGHNSYRQCQHLDRSWAEHYLHLSFEQASGLPENFEITFSNGRFEPQSKDIFKRINIADPNKIKWYLSPRKVGDIFYQRQVAPYPNIMRHSFSNQEYLRERLQRGKTHVAVGFVDLGVLLESELDGLETESLTFVGVEVSAYAVAKTLVIWELLQQTPKDPNQHMKHVKIVAQVWFSSTWTQGTETAVKLALGKLLTSPTRSSSHPEVKRMLQYWYDASTFPLAQARQQIKGSVNTACSEIGNFRTKSDRIAFGLYELTREFALGGQEPVCGNTLMFDCPDGTAPLDINESVFSCFPSPRVMDILHSFNEGPDVSTTSTTTIMDAAHKYAIQGLLKVSQWAITGQVTVELYCADISDVTDMIADKKPSTMSWSNICDYMDYKSFHQLAYRCSVHGDTIHYASSMNWLTDVYGVNLLDYRGKENSQVRSEAMKAAHQVAEKVYKTLKWDQRLRLPPPTNPINTTTHYLFAEKFYETWVSYFFDIANTTTGPPSGCQLFRVERKLGPPFSATGGSSLHFAFTYDPSVHIQTNET